AIAALGLSYLWVAKREWRPRITQDVVPDTPLALRLGIITFIVAITVPFLAEGFGTIFRDWDPVVSWNRWGRELSEGEYNPIGAAYPILFPALWSLVYQSQETADVWIITKASLSIAPFLLVLIAGLVAIKGKPVLAGIMSFLVVMTLFRDYVPNVVYLTSGHMDWPVAIFSMVSAGLLIRGCAGFDKREDRAQDYLTIGVVTAALAAITKQPGVLILGVGLVLVILLTLFRKVSWKQGGFLILIALAPLVSFLGLYNANKVSPIMGNIDQLTTLAEREHGTDRIISSYDLLFGPFPLAVLIIAAIFIICAFGLSKGWTRMSALLVTLVAVAGFFVFADCCSYDRRNGVWIVALLVSVMMTGIILVQQKLIPDMKSSTEVTDTSWIPSWSYLPVYLLIGIWGLSYPFSDKMIETRQVIYQKKIGTENFNRFLELHEPELAKARRVISYYQLMRYYPGYEERYVYCPTHDVGCVRRRIEQFGDNTYVIYHKGIAGERFRPEYEKIVDDGVAEVVAEDERFRLLRVISE
ncbi:MAG: hypothetical protein AAGA69_08750, partial [Pseudomonadota bacterium]